MSISNPVFWFCDYRSVFVCFFFPKINTNTNPTCRLIKLTKIDIDKIIKIISKWTNSEKNDEVRSKPVEKTKQNIRTDIT